MASKFSNIVHKTIIRIADMAQVAGGFKEANRKRENATVLANNTNAFMIIAPWTGAVESVFVASPTPTVSSSGNSVTVTVVDITRNTTVASFDTFVNATELAPANTAIEFDLFSPGISGGIVLPQFSAGDLLGVKIQVNGAPGPTSATNMNVQLVISPNDKNFAF